jgi:hypothetical protein
MKLEENGKASSGKHTWYFNIKYFYITDLIQCNDIQIEYCPTEEMVANYMTKALEGAKFEGLCKIIMNSQSSQTASTSQIGQKECVGQYVLSRTWLSTIYIYIYIYIYIKIYIYI